MNSVDFVISVGTFKTPLKDKKKEWKERKEKGKK